MSCLLLMGAGRRTAEAHLDPEAAEMALRVGRGLEVGAVNGGLQDGEPEGRRVANFGVVCERG
jgi:hypothetical protein